ncbi:MAG: TonB-dependent receptor [Burkholderiales bacterium]|nr:TonB-dependent receptor [Burkholderiales bacterium]
MRFPVSTGPGRFNAFYALALQIACAVILLAGQWPAAHAQQAPASRSYSIPAGPLPAVLTRFLAESGTFLAGTAELAQGKTSPGVQGSYTVQEGLARLLTGTGLQAVERARGNYALVAQAPPAAPVPPKPAVEQQLSEVKVQASGEVPGALPKPYVGGQVARGGRLGVLGNLDTMDSPFSQSSYTSQLMQDQQARTLGDVVKYDASVREQHGAVGDFKIRGFTAFNSEFLFDGLIGVTPTLVNLMPVETLERIEVLKGPSTFINGAGTNANVGGSINVVPKRAGVAPVTQVTASYYGKSQAGLHGDFGRRFGTDQQFGIRVNVLTREGDTTIDRQTEKMNVSALSLDYHGTAARASFDLAYQDRDQRGTRTGLGLAAGSPVPVAPNASVNYNNPWNFEKSQTTYGVLRGEVDLGEHATAFAAYGFSERIAQNAREFRTVTNANGDLAAGNSQLSGDRWEGRTTQVGIRGDFRTGPVRHRPVLAYNAYTRDAFRTRPNYAIPASNIYTPVFAPAPASVPDPHQAPPLQALEFASMALSNTFSSLDERVRFTLGARDQRIESTNFGAGGAVTSRYDQSRLSWMGGMVYKLRRNISLYGNYADGLNQGPTAPAGAANAGQVFPPFVSKQYEAGVKIDFGKLMTTASAFQIAQPSGILNPATNVFGTDGEQRHRGLELSAYGAPTPRWRVLGGLTLIDSELTKTAGGVNDGRRGPGVPRLQLNLGTEWDPSDVPGLTLFGTLIHTSSQYVDAANTQRIKGWDRLDLGVRYAIRALGRGVSLRASIENVLNKSYWANASPALEPSTPRNLLISATMDF